MLAVDIGNSHTVLGLFKDDGELLHTWRVRTAKDATGDEIASLLHGLFSVSGVSLEKGKEAAVASVVPSTNPHWEEALARILGKRPSFLTGDLEIGLKILYKRPFELGPDRLANALGAWRLHKGPSIVIDFGTATTFDCIGPEGEYLGGLIAPGLLTSVESLSQRTALLPRVGLHHTPGRALAQDTESAIRAGILFGFAAMADGLVSRLEAEMGTAPKALATGGLARLVTPLMEHDVRLAEDLTLLGIHEAWRRLKRARAGGPS